MTEKQERWLRELARSVALALHELNDPQIRAWFDAELDQACVDAVHMPVLLAGAVAREAVTADVRAHRERAAALSATIPEERLAEVLQALQREVSSRGDC